MIHCDTVTMLSWLSLRADSFALTLSAVYDILQSSRSRHFAVDYARSTSPAIEILKLDADDSTLITMVSAAP